MFVNYIIIQPPVCQSVLLKFKHLQPTQTHLCLSLCLFSEFASVRGAENELPVRPELDIEAAVAVATSS